MMRHQYAGTPPRDAERSALLPGTLTPRRHRKHSAARGGAKSGGRASLCLSWSWCVWENVVAGIGLDSVHIDRPADWWVVGGRKSTGPTFSVTFAVCAVSFIIMVAVYAWRHRAAAPMPLVVAVYLFGVFAAAPVALLETYVADAVFPEKPMDAMDVVRPAYELVLFSACNAFLVAALF